MKKTIIFLTITWVIVITLGVTIIVSIVKDKETVKVEPIVQPIEEPITKPEPNPHEGDCCSCCDDPMATCIALCCPCKDIIINE